LAAGLDLPRLGVPVAWRAAFYHVADPHLRAIHAHRRPLTAQFLARDGVRFQIVVEPQEADLYRAANPRATLTVLPFSNLGLGSIPARNWVWEDSRAAGFERHWILDDNIQTIYRRYRARRIRCNSALAFAAVEDFTDRYENVAISGLNYAMFAPDRISAPPFLLNSRVYSCLLIRNDLPYRWRGRYNEDTDLCLQALSGGWCTVQVNAFLIQKIQSMKMKGGNTDELYQGDGRLKMARSLERLWPGVVETKRRFGRPQHFIKHEWQYFTTPLKRKAEPPEIDPARYQMILQQVRPIETPSLQEWFDQQQGVR
jgi:hypothetical protein